MKHFYRSVSSFTNAWKCGKPRLRCFNMHINSQHYISTSTKNICYSQPTAATHPFLLKHGEVMPGVSAGACKYRRQKMMETVCKNTTPQSENSVAHLVVIPSASRLYMSEIIPYAFRQNSDFLYLSGFKEPNCVLLLHSLPNKSLPEHRCFVIIPKQSPHSVRWEGQKMDLNSVVSFLGVDEAIYMEDLERYLESFTKSNKNFTLWYDYLNTPFRILHEQMQNFIAAFSGSMSVESPRSVLHQIRLIKSDAEVELMRKSCKIAAESMREVMKFSRPQIPEAHLQAKMDFECRIRGADQLAFPPVIGGADRAYTIHYIDNNHIINPLDMVLMDAGCEYHGYTSDMSRTWPINGKFTDPQRELYEVILSAQEDLIHLCETKLPLDDLFEIMRKKLGKGLQELGVIPKSVSEDQLVQAAYQLCPHHVSHYLGMDVHDTSLISRSIKLQPGMVVTVEPGVYIAKNNTTCPDKYRGICIRIEDDVLITETGYEVLTAHCPKQVEQIEELFKELKV